MALSLFIDDKVTGVANQLVNNISTKIVAIHDSSDGSYDYSILRLENTDINLGYTDIQASIEINQIENGSISLNGAIYQLIAISGPSSVVKEQHWENIPYNNTIQIPDIAPGYSQSRYIFLKTFLPKGSGVDFFSEAKIRITAKEVAAIG
jgi:hypothetical protein